MRARLFFRTNKLKKSCFAFFKTALLSLVLLCTVLPSLTPAFAQVSPAQVRDIPAINRQIETPAVIRPYNTLFDISGSETSGTRSTLSVQSSDWASVRYATDLTYVFNGGFLVDPNINGYHNVGWYWDKIADASGNRKLFLLRVCNVGSDGKPVETTCAFSPWPYTRTVSDDAALTNTTFTAEEQSLINDASVSGFVTADIPQTQSLIASVNQKLAQMRTKKIYHYASSLKTESSGSSLIAVSVDNDEEIHNFSVEYKPTAFQYSNDTVGSVGKVLTSGQRYQADVWYCAAADDGLGDLAGNRDSLTNIAAQTDNIRVFELCDSSHLAYVRAAGVQFTVPQSQEEIDQANAGATGANINSNTGQEIEKVDVMPNCHILNGWGPGTGSFVGCIAFLFYYGIFWPISWFAGIMGNLFDFFLGYSLDDASYRAEFVVTGWRLVRDISNIFFIIILVWVGLATALSIPKVSMKKVVPQLILNALIINFSLFGTRLLVDISNVAARLFYNTISVCEGQCKDENGDGQIDNLKHGSTQYKPLSEKIVSAFDPQRIFTPALLTNEGISSNRGISEGNSAGITDTADDQDKENPLNKNSYATVFVIISIIAAFLMFATAMMFWKTAFFFLGRTIGLYISMIFAPFAVLTMGNMPIIGGIQEISWKDWWSNFIKYVTLAPIFVFFLYIVYSFINTDFLKIVAGRDTDGLFGGGFMPTIISISVPLLIVYFLVKQGVKIAETYAGTIGKMVQSTVGKTAGVIGGAAVATVAGVASGGLAAVGRGSLGRVGASMANSQTLRKWSGSNNWLARQVGNAGVRLGEKGAKAEYDVRNTSLLKTMGISDKGNFITKMTRTDKENTKGGVFGSQDRKEKRLYERMKTFQLTGDVKAAHNAKQPQKAANWDTKHWAPILAQYLQQNPQATSQQIAQQKQMFIQSQALAGNIRPETADEVNLRRNIQYGARLTRGNALTRFGNTIGLSGTGTGTTGALAGSGIVTGIGAGLSAIGGELATQRVAEQRAGRDINRLTALISQIDALTSQINQLLPLVTGTGTNPTQAQIQQLQQLQSKLQKLEKQKDDLNNKLTGRS